MTDYEKAKRGESGAARIARNAVFVALTLVFTAFVNIQVPSFGGAGGLIHLGNVPLFVAAILYGRRTGALSGALGMGMFDILSGWAAWAPCTVLVCGCMGYAAGAVCERNKDRVHIAAAMLTALVIKVVGYFAYESFLMGNGVAAALKSVPGNVIQVVVAAVVTGVAIRPLERALGAAGLWHRQKKTEG